MTLKEKIKHLQDELSTAKLRAKSEQKFRTLYPQNRSIIEIKCELLQCQRIMWRNSLSRWCHRLFSAEVSTATCLVNAVTGKVESTELVRIAD